MPASQLTFVGVMAAAGVETATALETGAVPTGDAGVLTAALGEAAGEEGAEADDEVTIEPAVELLLEPEAEGGFEAFKESGA